MTMSKLVLDPFSEEFFHDPYETYRRLRDEAPVYYSEQYDFYALTRHQDVAAAFKDHETYSSSRGILLENIQSGEHGTEQSIIWMDPPEHRRMRSLVNKVFYPPRHRSAEGIGTRQNPASSFAGRSARVRCRRGFRSVFSGRGDHHHAGRA